MKRGKKRVNTVYRGYRGKGDAPMTPEPSKRAISVLAIDPGIGGAFVVTDGADFFKSYEMPLVVSGKEKAVDFDGVMDLLRRVREELGGVHVFLERAVPMAMGSKGAFSYGRGFEALVIAVRLHEFPSTLVEPARWTKEMHEGISADLKPKARSLIAVKRLYPQLVRLLPRRPKGGLHDGPIDALLIAGYGLRKLGVRPPAPPAARCPVCGFLTYTDTGKCSRFGCPPAEDDVGDFL